MQTLRRSCLSVILLLTLLSLSAVSAEIRVDGRRIVLTAGPMARTLDVTDGNLSTSGLTVAGRPVLAEPAAEVSLSFHRAIPDECPRGVAPDEMAPIPSDVAFRDEPDLSEPAERKGETQKGETRKRGPSTFSPQRSEPPQAQNEKVECPLFRQRWEQVARVQSRDWAKSFNRLTWKLDKPAAGVTRLTVTGKATSDGVLQGVAISVVYETYDGFPVIRKRIRVANGGRHWLKIDRLTLDDVRLDGALEDGIPLTPAGRGAGSSVVAFESADRTCGLIAGSEIPSALRVIDDCGAMSYHPNYFEWVVGPGETFESEPVFHYAYHGPVEKTISAESLPRDRAVEGPYLRFLQRHVGVAADTSPVDAPHWNTWSNFGPNVTDAIVREMAQIAGRCGFATLSIDDGWQRDRLGTEPHAERFPDMEATARYVRSQGLRLGLWLSCFRSPGSKDLEAVPDGRAVPWRTRLSGYGMSFASPWRDYYAADLVGLYRRYDASYFKQDFTNIKLGDVAAGHESRTRKESLLRSFRGLFETQDRIRREAPEVITQITHEIYWGTPGVPCDLAVLKYASRYHIPPNDTSGAGHGKRRVDRRAKVDPNVFRRQLIRGCDMARQRIYAHRGLPLYALEYYAATTVNLGGSLTPEVQDRQICSWLLGAPLVFAGDLASLTEENIRHYADRFALVGRLQSRWNIYRHFQWSGVPEPTDADWHWWGKLDERGCGAVVVLRGDGGKDRRAINVPWVAPAGRYRVTALFAKQDLGVFDGRELQGGELMLSLPRYGQEILELTDAP